MYLSKLEIIGFKSFAQKVNLAFDSGISAIVGPNGCGKTNIVDAIRWVLGEQRYSALRSEKMEDVIFNGTKARKPLGMAEASLVIENTKGILPSEYSQVTIGRRVYRSGESEYLLNKVPCRLKDIMDLFMDTGMGPDAYSVIELKMVETILSDKTDERRRLFEEAAGVTKYKHRRKAAHRKLEAVQADLVRVSDIVTEVQKAVATLERQAKKAEQHNDITARLRAMDLDLLEREYSQFLGRIDPLAAELEEVRTARSRQDVDLSAEEERLDRLRAGLADADQRLAAAQRAVAAHRDAMHGVEERKLVAAERLKALTDNARRFADEQRENEEELRSLETARVGLERRILDLGLEEASVADELARRRRELEEAESRRDATRTRLQELNDRTIALVQVIADLQNAQERRRGRMEHLRGRAVHAREELESYEGETGRLATEIRDLTATDKDLRRAFGDAEHRFHDAEARRTELRERMEEVQRREAGVQAEIDRRRAKAEFLRGLIDSREGMGEGVRFLASTDRWSTTTLTVADALQAEPHLRPALEAALGDAASLVIVEHESDAEQAVLLLKEEDRGKAAFVSLDRVPVLEGRWPAPDGPGIIGWAVDCARYEERHAALFRLLFDRTLIVEDLPTARAVARRRPGIRCVTLDGEFSTGFGVSRGGSRRQDEGGIIGKEGQIRELEADIALIDARRAELVREREDLQREHDAIDLRSLQEDAKTIEKEMTAVEVRMAQLQFEKRRAEEIILRNREEIATLGTEADRLAGELALHAPDLGRQESDRAEVDRMVGAVTAELEALEASWSACSAAVQDLGIRLATVGGELAAANTDLGRSDRRARETAAAIERRTGDVRRTGEESAARQAEADAAARELSGMQEELRSLQERRGAVEAEAARVRRDIHSIELRLKDERRSHEESLRTAHDLELRIADLTAKAEHVRARALEEYDATLVRKPEEGQPADLAALREDIQRLRDRLKTLGNINFAAFEEYRGEKDRYEFLSAQRKDLIDAEKTLLATIEEINATAQRKFLDTFAQIRTNFIETFKSLFDPGDECDLRLEENVDPLEAGIEIIAKPRGKRPTSIDLLSGGEKTLTATALLFAIYLVKPSPFCILDEVDAPLDDANIDRFTRILRKFSANTQFIVVTHNKRTMEAANALYGVTMEEEGVSKLVTVRFQQGAQLQSAALATG